MLQNCRQRCARTSVKFGDKIMKRIVSILSVFAIVAAVFSSQAAAQRRNERETPDCYAVLIRRSTISNTTLITS